MERAFEKQLTIGNVVLENPVVLGPMAGVTDLPFRLICKEHGFCIKTETRCL